MLTGVLVLYYVAALAAGRLKYLRLPSGYRSLLIYLSLPPLALCLNLLYPGLYALPLTAATAFVLWQAGRELALRRAYMRRHGVGRIR
jgi:hypothetical protein